MLSSVKIRPYIELLRFYNLVVPLCSFFMGLLLLGHQHFSIDIILGVLIIILAHSFAIIQNDIADFQIDVINSPTSPLQRKLITITDAKKLQAILGILVLLAGLIRPLPHLFFGITALSVSWFYNKRPFQLSRKPIWSILSLGTTSTLLPMSYGFWLANKNVTQAFFLTLFFWFFLRISITLLKDFKDQKGDKKFQKQTFNLKFGNKFTAWTSLALALISYIGIFVTAFLIKTFNLLFLLPSLMIVYNSIIRLKLLSIKNSDEGNAVFYKSFIGENRFEVVYLLWLILS